MLIHNVTCSVLVCVSIRLGTVRADYCSSVPSLKLFHITGYHAVDKAEWLSNRLWDSLHAWGSGIMVSHTLPTYLSSIHTLIPLLVIIYIYPAPVTVGSHSGWGDCFYFHSFTEGTDISMEVWYRSTRSAWRYESSCVAFYRSLPSAIRFNVFR